MAIRMEIGNFIATKWTVSKMFFDVAESVSKMFFFVFWLAGDDSAFSFFLASR